jgi:hypothetical protein
MKRILNVVSRGIVIAALFALGTGVAHAQNWPNGSAYDCDWTLGAASGKSFITFQSLTGDDFVRSGTLKTVYTTGAVVTKPITVYWDWPTGDNSRFIMDQTQDGIECTLVSAVTANNHKVLTFSPCSNGASQHCVQ